MQRTCLFAGIIYLGIILLGLSAELLLRAPLLGASAEETAALVTAAPNLLSAAIVADALMIVLDVALAILLWGLLRPVGPTLSALAAAFRLIQASVLAANLLLLQAATFGAADGLHTALLVHAAGYDLGLLFFAVSTAMVAVLLARWESAPNLVAGLLAAAAAVYATGSIIRMLVPDAAAAFAPAYLIPVVAELAFAVTLVWLGFRSRKNVINGDQSLVGG